MRLGIPSGAEGALGVRLAWLTALRLVVLTVVLVLTATLYVGGLSFVSFSSRLALVTVGSAYGVAALYAVLLRSGRRLAALTYAQLVTDQIAWTGLVYVSGGVASGATSLYGLTCVCGAILLGTPGALTAAISGAASYGVLCVGFGLGLLGPPPDQPPGAYATDWADMAYPLLVNLMGIAVLTLLASYLAERLRTTGGRLVAATQRAEEAERLAIVGRLAAALAHEIRNPLGAIAGSIELLRTGGTLSPEDQRLCEVVERETARLDDLVSDMLDLARPRPPARVPTDLGATARDVVTLAARSGRGADVRLAYEGPRVVIVSADPAQMRQIVWNLVRNAIQASKPGEEVAVTVRAERDGLSLAITDHGAGIPADARARLFDAFFTTRAQGVGIGLAVVKRIVDDHGFRIEVESEENLGTTFRVHVPKEAVVEVSVEASPAALAELAGG